jgi:uncharacterized protein DUF4386
MQEKKGGGRRRNEVTTGLILILVAISYIASLLLDFKFVSPYATLQEDLSYLAEHALSQKISSFAWMITAAITALASPFYLSLFRKKLKVMPYLNALFMLCASAGFLAMSLTGLELHRDISGLMAESIEQTGDQLKLLLLDHFRREQNYRLLGSSFVGVWALGLSLTRFRVSRFPMVSTILLMISGPVLIFFNWYDPDHLGRTGAMAGIIIGVAIFCVRLINKGLAPNTDNTER